MTSTRIPSEEELIELENVVLFPLERMAADIDAYARNDRLVATLRALLDLARLHSHS